MREIVRKVIRILLKTLAISSAVVLLALASFAQTDSAGTGSTKPAVKKKPPAKAKPSPKADTRPKVEKPKPTAKKPTVVKPVLSTLTIAVNEPGSRISVVEGTNALVGDVAMAADGSDYVLDDLKPGNYDLIVKKAGFVDHRERVTIAGKAIRREIRLQPAMAYLNLSVPGVPDASIEIAGVGKFTGSVVRRPLRLGTYSAIVSRKGYVTATEQITLAAHNAELNRVVTLRKVPVSTLIAEAEAAMANSDLSTAESRLTDALETEPENAKANLLLGTLLHEKGESGAVSYFFKAIQGGETVTLDVHAYLDDRLLVAKMRLDKSYLKIEFPDAANVQRNASFLKTEFRDVEFRTDKQNPRFARIRGRAADNRNRKSDRTIGLYSTKVLLNGKTPTCRATDGASRCDNDASMFHDLIGGWQSRSF